jgi:hypothetical protein
MKPLGQEGDCLFVVQIEIVLFDLLLYEAPRHQECSPELVGLNLFTVDSSRRVSVSPERQMTINKEL